MLNECGAYIYRAYISGMSEDEITQAFAKEYGLSFSCAQSDVGQFDDGVKTTGNYLRRSRYEYIASWECRQFYAAYDQQTE